MKLGPILTKPTYTLSCQLVSHQILMVLANYYDIPATDCNLHVHVFFYED